MRLRDQVAVSRGSAADPDAGPARRRLLGLLVFLGLLIGAVELGRVTSPVRPGPARRRRCDDGTADTGDTADRSGRGALRGRRASGGDGHRRRDGLTRRLHPRRSARLMANVVATPLDPTVTNQLELPPQIEQVAGIRADQAARRQVVSALAALAARVDSYTPTAPSPQQSAQVTATVAVWTVSVLGTSRLAEVGASYYTSTLREVWQGGRWRVAGSTITAGPVSAPARPADPLEQVRAATLGMTPR